MIKLKHTIFFFLIFLQVGGVVFSQKKELKQAEKDFDTRSFIDAREIYLKIVDDGYTSAQIYRQLGDTYYYDSDYKNASNWYLKLVEAFPNDLSTTDYYRAAQSLRSIDEQEKSDDLMELYTANGGKSMLGQQFTNDTGENKKYDVIETAINTESSDFGPSFYGNKLVFASPSKGLDNEKMNEWNGQPFLDLFSADMDDEGNLSNVVSFENEINTRFHESSAVFTKDGTTMYFTRNNFINGKRGRDKDKQRTIRLKIYKATKGVGANQWTDVVELPFNSDNYSVAYPALSTDEKKLYFSSDMPGTLGMSDLWFVTILDNNNYSLPKNLGAKINTEAREAFPYISENNTMYFSSDGRGGIGGLDVYSTAIDTEGLPGEIENLGTPVNSNQDDFGFILNEENKLGFFSSSRAGEGGSINDDIYKVIEICEITISGVVTDLKTGEIIPNAKVVLLNADKDEITSMVSGPDGTYSFLGDCNLGYVVHASKDGYIPTEKTVITPNETGTIDLPLEIEFIPVDPCPPNDLGCRLTLLPIYFDLDKHFIRPDAEIELSKILAAMQLYPQLNIHIESHTDSRATDSYNIALSERRAQSTLNWLVYKGVDSGRLSARGYGESQLVNQCSNDVKCNEADHQLNRRSMFIIKD